jgi:hypothetical protein
MPDDVKTPAGARTAAIVLSVVCGLLWIVIAPSLGGLGRSDPAGNAMAQGFAGLGLILLWLLLSILALIAATKGAMPSWTRPALLLVPASGVAALGALELLARPGHPPGHWPMLIPLFVPPLIVTYCLWALLRPPMTGQRAAALLGAIAVLSAAIVPLTVVRRTTIAQEENTSASQRATVASLPADAPLWDFVPFLDARDQRIGNEARARIRALARRQADAEAMLARGDFPLGYLGAFALELTPSLCEKARALLRQRAAALVLPAPGSKPYGEIEGEVSAAFNALSWLIGYGCDAGAESLAWETMAKAYRDPRYTVSLLAGLREPGQLGRTLRQDPERFEQLNQESHLKAWIKFTDDPALRDKVIAGARTLPRRTAEAIEILTDKNQESGRFRLLRIWPGIDLEPTPALCAAATKEIGPSLKGVYRPGAGDTPLHYYDLLSRLGVGNPLATLVWLAEHGCDVGEQLRDAEAAVRAYQDSPGRAAMLATLARLQGGR